MSQFIKQTVASLIGSLAGLILFFTLGASGLFGLLLLATSKSEQPQVKEKSVLVFDLSTDIKDNKLPSSLSQAFTGEDNNSISIRQVLNSIEQASKDEKITAILLDGRKADTRNGYATLEEIRQALERFRAAGKKIIAYDVDGSEKKYYLSSVADRVIINPIGSMEINGFSTQQLFYSAALAKYGIGVQVVRVGDYKSAVEPFTRQNLSLENRQQTQELLGDLWTNFSQSVAKSRRLSAAKLQAITSTKGILDAKEALSSGLVDQVGYFDEVVKELKKLNDENGDRESFRQVSIQEYTQYLPKSEQSFGDKIAIVYAEGEIVGGEGGVQQIGGDRYASILRQIRNDDEIKALVLRVNSPGGSATASEVILREIQLMRQEKPVIVSMGDYAASGGYWIATGGDRIFAQENTITGSIGVFGILPNLENIAKNNGITSDVVKTNPLADINSSVRAKTGVELAIYQKSVNQIYDLFLDKVSNSRHLSKDKVAQIARGRVWSGQDAKNISLVDEIGGLDAAIAYAAKKANLEKDWSIEEYPQQKSFEAEVLGKLFSTQALAEIQKSDPLTAEFLKFKSDLEILQSLRDPKGIYARLPLNLTIK